MNIFGPIPSRRLGRSLGINNIPPKTCSYSCVYCQVGKTDKMKITRDSFYEPQKIKKEVEKSLNEIQEDRKDIDYLTFVAEGEPTLDVNLGQTIKQLKELRIKIAVISNASLIYREDVRKELVGADWVSLKCDAVSDNVWRKVDRPHGNLDKKEIHEGMFEFSHLFSGTLVTETMLIKNINDKQEELEKVADLLQDIDPDISYISIPTRPPAEEDVLPASGEVINKAFQIFKTRKLTTEYLIGYEGNEFASTGNIEKDLLSITAVHPLKEEAVKKLLDKCGAEWEDINRLLDENKIKKVKFEEANYYLRTIKK